MPDYSEKHLLTEFQRRAEAYFPNVPEDDQTVEWLALMQCNTTVFVLDCWTELDLPRTEQMANLQAPEILPALVRELVPASQTSAETSGHALRRTREDENWGVRKLEAQGYKVTLEAAA